MQIHTTLPSFETPTAVVLGLFDGVHMGHRKLFQEAVYFAYQNDRPVVALTFDLSDGRPASKKTSQDIFPLEERYRRLESLGVKHVVVLPFIAVKDLSPETFFNDILKDNLHAKELYCGTDYRFGAGAKGDANLLSQLGKANQIYVSVVDAVCVDDAPVSSTRIRAHLAQGQIKQANALLGQPYSVTGPVMAGKQLGRTIQCPTINQVMHKGGCWPRFGVYVVRVWWQKKWHPGVANLGIKPTVDNDEVLLETHIFDFSQDLYGAEVMVQLLDFVRLEQKFDSIDSLKNAIHTDIHTAKTFFEKEQSWIF